MADAWNMSPGEAWEVYVGQQTPAAWLEAGGPADAEGFARYVVEAWGVGPEEAAEAARLLASRVEAQQRCDDPECPGWVLNMGDPEDVERCDQCGIFPDDDAAREAFDRAHADCCAPAKG